jgi:hypothetical protein
MTPTETVKITRLIAATCPQQHIDRYTPDAWRELMADLEFTDCWDAILALGKVQPFIAPAEIRGWIHARNTQDAPHSNACRARDCRDCVWSWCRCQCHRNALSLTRSATVAIEQRRASAADAAHWASEARRLLDARETPR